MIQYSIVTEQPDTEPVTLTEAKTHLEYSGEGKNGYIASLITTARRLSEAYAGLSFITQTRRVKLDYFPCTGYDFVRQKLYIELPYGPVQSVESFTYLNDDGVTTTTLTEGTNFTLDSHSRIARLYPIENGEMSSWPTDVRNIPHAITIDYNAGYDDVSGETMPSQIKQAIYMYLTLYFENRGDNQGKGFQDALPWHCMNILDSIKVTWNANYE
jgi:uncharacterized phiE125 gp8 family phage protein